MKKPDESFVLRTSALPSLLESPAHFLAYYNQVWEDTQAMLFGRVAHVAALEPHKLSETIVTIPEDINLRTKEGRQQRDDILASIKTGQELLKPSEANAAIKMAEVAKAGPFREWIDYDNPRPLWEYELQWKDETYGIDCGSRLDIYQPNQATIIDYKTTSSLKFFKKDIFSYHYHVKMAWQRQACLANGLEVDGVFLAAQEKKPPYACLMYELTPEVLAWGWELCCQAMETLNTAMAFDFWPCYVQEQAIQVELPAWANREDNDNENY